MPALSTRRLKLQQLLLRILDSSQECSTTLQELPCQAHEELLALLDCCLNWWYSIRRLCSPRKPAWPAGRVAHKPHLQRHGPYVGCRLGLATCVQISSRCYRC